MKMAIQYGRKNDRTLRARRVPHDKNPCKICQILILTSWGSISTTRCLGELFFIYRVHNRPLYVGAQDKENGAKKNKLKGHKHGTKHNGCLAAGAIEQK